MPRSEARISVDIWDDPDFCALSPGAQRMYAFLVSQRDLAHDGVLALRERRWTRSAAGLTVDQITADLDELEQARFVIVDYDAEEILIRSLIRRDKIYRQPNVLRAAADHLPMVSSPAIRRAIAIELARIAEEPMPDGSRSILDDMRRSLPNPSGNPSPNPSGVSTPEGSGNPTEVPTRGTPGERGVVTEVSTDSPYPEPRSPDPVPRRTPPESGARERALDGPEAAAAIDHGSSRGPAHSPAEQPDPAVAPDGQANEGPGSSGARPASRPGGVPKSSGTRVPDDFEPTPEMVEWARDNAPTTSRTDHEAFMDYWRSVPGVKGRKLDWVMTWRNWMRREHERRTSNGARASPAGQPRPSTTDQRVAQGLALVQRLEANESKEIAA